MKGMIYRDQGNAENARSSFQTAVEVNPNFFDGYIALGLAYAADMDTLALGYFETAKNCVPKAWRPDTTSPTASRNTSPPTAGSWIGPSKGIPGNSSDRPVQRCICFQPRLHFLGIPAVLRQRGAPLLQGH